MRKLFILFLTFLALPAFPQSYRVNYSQTSSVSWGKSVPYQAATNLASVFDNQNNLYYCGNFADSPGFSYIKKFNSKGEIVKAYLPGEKVFFNSAVMKINNLNQLIIISESPVYLFTVNYQIRLFCFDSDLNLVYSTYVPYLPIYFQYYIADIQFDSDNNIYAAGNYWYSEGPTSRYQLNCYKFNSSGVLQWTKSTNTYTPGRGKNNIFKITDNSIYVIATCGSLFGLDVVYRLFEFKKDNGDILKFSPFTIKPNTPVYSNNKVSVKEKNGNVYLAYTVYEQMFQRDLVIQKFNSNWDSVWTRQPTGALSLEGMQIDDNENVYITGSTSSISYDANGSTRWISTYHGAADMLDGNNYVLYAAGYNEPIFTNLNFSGTFLSSSDKYPYPVITFDWIKDRITGSNYKFTGLLGDTLRTFLNTVEKDGRLTHSIMEGYLNDYATDLIYNSDAMYLASYSKYKADYGKAFITKLSTNGSEQWSKEIFPSTQKISSANSIVYNSGALIAGGESFDSASAKFTGKLVSLDNSGNTNYNVSLAGAFSGESSIKSLKLSGSSVIAGGQYKDSAGNSKVFILKNTNGTNDWIVKCNIGVTSNDSLASIAADTLGNCFVVFNEITGGFSKKYYIIKFNSSGSQVYSVNNFSADGIFIGKAECDKAGNIFTAGSVKVSGNYDFQIQKFDQSGASQWTSNYANLDNTDDLAKDIVVDKNGNVTGVCSSEHTSNGALDFYYRKLTGMGELQGSAVYNAAGRYNISKLVVDDLNSVYVCGVETNSQNPNLTRQNVFQIDAGGNIRQSLNFNSKDSTNLIFANNFSSAVVLPSSGNTKKLFTAANTNRINRGAEIKITGFTGSITGVENSSTLVPDVYSLSQNYPNPFNPVTVINYKIPVNGYVSLKIYDISGREIVSLVGEIKNAGEYSVRFDGKEFSSGTYFYKLTAGNFSEVKKMVLLK